MQASRLTQNLTHNLAIYLLITVAIRGKQGTSGVHPRVFYVDIDYCGGYIGSEKKTDCGRCSPQQAAVSYNIDRRLKIAFTTSQGSSVFYRRVQH